MCARTHTLSPRAIADVTFVTEPAAVSALQIDKGNLQDREVPEMAIIRILFVDDSDDDVFITKHKLRKAGFEFEARTVALEHELREAISSFSPDIVVSDMTLPGYSGLDALDMVRRHHPEIPFMFLCGGAERCQRQALERGAYAIVDKDHAEALPALIGNALSS
jgi:CheY-like chemotaxis protein